MKNAVNGLIRLDTAEGGISDLEDMSTETQREKGIKTK